MPTLDPAGALRRIARSGRKAVPQRGLAEGGCHALLLGAIQGGPDSRWVVRESPSLGPPSPWGSCQHGLSFLGHVPWRCQHQEVGGFCDSQWGLDHQAWGAALGCLPALAWAGPPGSVGAEGVSSGRGPSGVCCLTAPDLLGEGCRRPACLKLAEPFWDIRPSPSMYRRENRGPERAHSKLQFPVSHLTCTISGSQSTALHGLFFGDSKAGVDPGVLLGKLGLLNQVAPVVWKELKMVSTPPDCPKD